MADEADLRRLWMGAKAADAEADSRLLLYACNGGRQLGQLKELKTANRHGGHMGEGKGWAE